MKNQHNTNSSSGRFTTDTPQRENEQTTRSFTMRNMGRGLLLGLSLSIATFSVATAQTGSLQGRRVILNDGGLTTGTFNRIQLNTPADGSLTGDYNLILPPSNGAVDNILFVESVPSAGNSQLNFTSGDQLFWKLKGNNTTFTDGTNNLLGTLTNDPLNIITNNLTRVRITNAGNVGIGAGNTPSQLFAVGGGAGGNLTINNAGDLVTAGNVTVNGTGTNTIGVAATTNNILGTTTVTGTTNINTTGNAVTTIGSLANTGGTNIRANGAITLDVNATTNNLVLNNILSAVPAPTDYTVWMTAAGNNVRRTLLSGTADQGLMFEAGQYRLGNSTDGNTPIVSSRFVRVGALGTLTFNSGTANMLTLNNNGNVDVSTTGTGVTTIGNGTGGNVNVLSGGTIAVTGTTNINTTGNAVTTIGSLANTGGTNIRANGTITIDVNNVANNVVMNNIATGLNSNDVLLINGTNQVRRLASNQFAWLITGNGHVVTDNVNNLLGTTTAADLRVITNNVTRMVVNGTGGAVAVGNIGIGTSADATYRLAIAPNATGNGVLVTGAPVTGLRIEDPSGTGITVGAASAPTTGIIVQAGTTGMTIGSVTPPTALGLSVRTAGAANGITVDQSGASDLVINETSISRAAANIAINPGAANLVTTDGNVTIIGANTNTIGVAATTNNILGATNINNNVNANTQINTGTSTGSVTIGNTAITSGAVNIRSGGTSPTTIDVGTTTNNLVLNNINSVAPIDDILWITAGTNQVRRTPFTGTADEGIQFNSSAYRLGHLVNGSAPIVNPRFVRVGAAGTLTFNTATTTSLILNNSGQVDLNTVGGANTNIGSATTGTVAITGATISETAANVNVNTTLTGATTIGSTATGGAVAFNSASTITSLAPNVNVNNSGSGATTIGSTGTGGAVAFNSASTVTSLAPNVNVNNSGTGATTIGNLATGGAVNVRTNTGITLDLNATTNNLVLNSILSTTPGASDDILWITNVGNNVRRTGFSGLANEGIQYQNSAFRLGSNAVDVNPITSARIVTVGAAGTLTFSTAAGANTMLTLNNTGVVGLNTAGGANTNIGTTGAGTITLGGATINATAPTMTSTSTTSNTINAATLTLNSTAGYVTAIGNATGNFSIVSNELNVATSGDISDATGNVIVADNLDVTGTGTNNIGVAAASNTVLGTTTVTGNTTINSSGAFTTNIATGTNSGLTTIGNTAVTSGGLNLFAGGTSPITINPGVNTNNVVMSNIANDATPLSMLSLNASNQVRSTALSNMANQGLMYEGGEFRLGHSTDGSNPITSSRFVRVAIGGTLTFNSGAPATMLQLNSNGNVDISTTGAAKTEIGNATGGNVNIFSGSTITIGGTTNINTATTANTSIGNATGTFDLASNRLNVAGATGDLSNTGAAAPVSVNDVDGFTVNTGGGADLAFSETTISRAGAITVNQGANLLTLGNVGGTTTIAGVSGTPNITATSLASSGAPAFSHPTDGIVIADNTGLLRRRPVTDLINASNGVIYNETGTDAEIRLGTLAAGTGALTNALTAQRYVNLGTAGSLSFNRGAGANNMLNLNGATGVITMDGSTVNINNTLGNNTTIGNTTGTFGLTSTQLNINSTNGELTDAAGAVTVNDVDGFVVNASGGTVVVNTAGTADLVITETTISRATADIQINPGGGNTVSTDGSLTVAKNAQFGSNTSETFAVNAGSGLVQLNSTNQIRLLGPTNINTTGSQNTAIGSLLNTGGVDIAGQNSVTVATGGSGNVYIQQSGNGDVVIGNTATTNDLTLNTNIRGAGVAVGSNRFAERITIAGTGAATYQINNQLVTANGVIMVTLENYTGVGVLSYQTAVRTPGLNFQITFSNPIAIGENVTVNYMIINP